ncbi:hypothetical protein ACFQDG_15920 [Natronoarchaeum mannanilyticum]|uniref:C2H2-type domain-containing protein n=1 Tax=Natronoarchaeum mannanilyticum TaxID=926360 RepID=A0AAV3T6I1_9EURY
MSAPTNDAGTPAASDDAAAQVSSSAAGTASAPEPTVAVPEGEQPAARCRYCDRPFRDERLYALHLGEAHPDACSDAERERYEAIYDEENHDLFTFHVKVVVTLLVTYFVFTYLYGFVWA